MPDAFIPSLAPFGLDRIPGYRVDPQTGEEDAAWRGEWFARREEIKIHRLWHQKQFYADPQFRKRAIKQYRQDFAYFITMWLVVEEPRGESLHYGEEDKLEDLEAFEAYLAGLDDVEQVSDDTIDDRLLEFIPYAEQVMLIQMFQRINAMPQDLDVYIDKARGFGVSYVILAAAYTAWLFRPWRGIFLSDKLERADRSFDLSSMFGKVDLFVKFTPKALIPEGFNGKSVKHRQGGMFKNPVTDAQLTAVATTPEAGRGDRGTYSCSDESPFQEHYAQTHATLEGTVRHRWCWGSPSYAKGRQWEDTIDAAKKMERSARGNGKRPTAIVIELDWYLQPYQDRRWYERTKARFDATGRSHEFQVEYLRNPAGGYTTFIYPEVTRCPDTEKWYDPSKPLNASIDPGIRDETAIAFWQTDFSTGHKVVRWIDLYVCKGPPAEFYAHIMTGIPPVSGDLMFEDDHLFGEKERYFMDWLRQVPPHHLRMYGDPSVAADSSGVVRFKKGSFENRFFAETKRLRQRAGIDPPTGIKIHHKELNKRNKHQDRRLALHEALVYSEFTSNDGAQELKNAIKNVRLQEMTQKSTSAPGWIHDYFTHPTSAAEFGMGYETLKLTIAELAPKEIDPLKGSKRRNLVANRAGFRPNATTSTLLEMA